MSQGFAPDLKIIDLLNARKENDAPFTSIEYFPPRTEDGVKNLSSRMDRMLVNLKPLFSDITWGAGGSTADLSLRLALLLKQTGHVSNLHVTCTNMDREKLIAALQSAHEGGIRNIVALRGDPPAGETEWHPAAVNGFSCALDLVKYIRSVYGDAFGICVAGYPEGHPDAIEEVSPHELTEREKVRSSFRNGVTYVCREDKYIKELAYLKEKVDAGADFILTQMFFDVPVFKQFVEDCRNCGINCPIIPGIMCIHAYGGFNRMTNFCKTRVPEWLSSKMEALKDDELGVKQFGAQVGIQMCRGLFDLGVPGLHFYTLNLESPVYAITDGLGLTSGLSKLTWDADATLMAAVGSAWARVGDKVKSLYGSGTVREMRKDGTAVIVVTSWELAGGQHPTAFLQKGSYQKAF